MPSYDFSNISPIDFEDLTRDLLQKHFGEFFESFAAGKDQGIDLRYSKNKENTIVVQCKKCERFNYLKPLLKKEVEKVKILSPPRYILVTSTRLTPSNKDQIINIYEGYIKNTSDILGRKDLNNLLGLFPEIERQHFKLWLPSTAMLQHLINSGILNRTEFEKEKILKDIKIYVQNESYDEAAKKLNDYNFVLISGIPGIGKSTLAKILILNYLRSNYELIVVSSDIDEAEKLFKPEVKQVFYYDDFLGKNFLDVNLAKNEDQRLINFIDKIKNSHDKKLIMTTREYILNQAKLKYETFDDSILDVGKCIVDLEKYTNLIRAKILYNHIYFSNLPANCIESLISNNNYLKIIKHKNFNPRIIQLMTNNYLTAGISSKNFIQEFLSNLDNPINIWKHAFSNHIKSSSRYLLYILFISGHPIYKEDLEKSYYELLKRESQKYNFEFSYEDFHKSLKELENTFIEIIRDSVGNNLIRFQNPSIVDFILNKIRNDQILIKSLIESAIFFNQLFNVFTGNLDEEKYKIMLKGDLITILIECVINKFDYLTSSRLIEVRSGYSDKIFWERSQFSQIAKLHKIANFFNLETTQIIKKFVIGKLKVFDLDGSHSLPADNYLLLDLLIKLKDQSDIDHIRFLDFLFYSIECTEDITNLLRLEKYFNKEFEQFVKRDKEFLYKKIEYIFSEELRWEYVDEDIQFYHFDSLKDDIKKIQEDLNIDLSSYLKAISNKIGKYENYEPSEEDIEYLSSSIQEKNLTEQNVDESIIDMFNSLVDRI